MPTILLGIIVSYLIGSVPTAYIFVRLAKGVDIRKIGSGNVGATNVMRILGKGAGILVLILDALKGFVAVFFIGSLISPASENILTDEAWRIILGISCIFGHNWTVFLNFKGGKGMATGLGVFLGLAFRFSALKLILLLLFLTWFLVFLITHIVSISSVITAAFLPIYMIFTQQSKILFLSGLVLSVVTVLRHKSNLLRFLQGKESRLF